MYRAMQRGENNSIDSADATSGISHQEVRSDVAEGWMKLGFAGSKLGIPFTTNGALAALPKVARSPHNRGTTGSPTSSCACARSRGSKSDRTNASNPDTALTDVDNPLKGASDNAEREYCRLWEHCL